MQLVDNDLDDTINFTDYYYYDYTDKNTAH